MENLMDARRIVWIFSSVSSLARVFLEAHALTVYTNEMSLILLPLTNLFRCPSRRLSLGGSVMGVIVRANLR
jgi:hypothetical protein